MTSSPEIYRLHGVAPGTSPASDAWLATIHPDDREWIQPAIAELVAAAHDGTAVSPDSAASPARTIEREYRVVLPDGAVRWIASRVRLVEGADGRPARLLGADADITERKRVEEALREGEAHHRYAVEFNPQIPWTAAPDGCVLEVSSRWLELTGLTREQTMGNGWMAAVHPDDLSPTLVAWSHAVSTGTAYDHEYRIRLLDGVYRWMRVRASPRRDDRGEVVRWYGTTEDVHDRRAAESDRERLLLAERAARAEIAWKAADAARCAAEEASRAKSEFLARMSHELRTPLNAIVGYAQLLDMGLHGPVTAAQREALGRITRAQQHLLTLINDVLQFAKLEAGQPQLNIVDIPLAELCGRLEGLIGPEVAAKRRTFTCEMTARTSPAGASFVARADWDRVLQILVNLVMNALKYTDESGTIALTAAADAERVYVRVRDTGRGIPPDQREAIFQPFVQLDDARAGRQGVGLGLTISRDLARAMGGDVTVESTAGSGSTFTLTLQRSGVP
jgi:PAS domain S-box-containing protein